MIFQSKFKEHRLVIAPQRIERTNFGQNIIPGKAIEFKNFKFETEVQEEIDFIKSHPSFGIDVTIIPSKEEQEDALLKKAEEIKAQREAKESKASKVEELVKKAKK